MEKDDLSQCIQENRVSMLRLALSITGRGADAEDAVSAAVVAAFEKREHLREQRKAPSWLLTITARKCYDLLRRRKSIVPAEDLPDVPVFQESLTGTVFSAIHALPESYSQVLTLFYYEGFDAGEIAEVLGLSRTTVFMRLSRGRKLLQAALTEEGVTC